MKIKTYLAGYIFLFEKYKKTLKKVEKIEYIYCKTFNKELSLNHSLINLECNIKKLAYYFLNVDCGKQNKDITDKIANYLFAGDVEKAFIWANSL